MRRFWILLGIRLLDSTHAKSFLAWPYQVPELDIVAILKSTGP